MGSNAYPWSPKQTIAEFWNPIQAEEQLRLPNAVITPKKAICDK